MEVSDGLRKKIEKSFKSESIKQKLINLDPKSIEAIAMQANKKIEPKRIIKAYEEDKMHETHIEEGKMYEIYIEAQKIEFAQKLYKDLCYELAKSISEEKEQRETE